MKLTSLVVLSSVVADFPLDRYIADDPLCPDIATCYGDPSNSGMKCKGRLYTNSKGRIRLQSKQKKYASTFNCRWEIKGPKDSKVRIKITQGYKKFGIEHHKICGNDRLHVQSITGDRYGRLCSTAAAEGTTYNGLPAPYTYNKEKIQSKYWQDWIQLPTNHLVIGFDSDRLYEHNRGFRLVYEIVNEYTVPQPVRKEIIQLQKDEQQLRDDIFTPGDKYFDRISQKIKDHFDQLFEKWHQCGGASLDPTLTKPKKLQRQNNQNDNIKAIYERYRLFIVGQLQEVGTCKPQHVSKIVSIFFTKKSPKKAIIQTL